MAELKRIFSNRRLCICLLMILFLNGFLFVREQSVQNYGLDCKIPVFLISYTIGEETYEIEQETVDSREAYVRYLQWLNEYKKMPIADAISELAAEKEQLTDILKIAELLKNDDSISSVDSLEKYRVKRPELVQKLEKGEIDLHEVHLDYVAVDSLIKQSEYLNSYGDYLDSIQTKKEKMLSFSIFNKPDSFSGRNIIKTAEEFEKLDGVLLTLGADGAITAFMDFLITDYLLLAVLILICISFLDERKKGLWNVVNAAPNGRFRLALQRAGILLGTSFAGVLLLCGTDLLIGFSVYGGIEELGRAVQSVELLGRMALCCTIGEFLLLFLIFKVGATFLVALVLWLIFTAVNNVKYTIVVIAGVLIVEYSFYTFLPVQSGLNVFKYFNIFTYISLSDLYTNYLNIDLFDYPVGIREVSQYACIPLIVLLSIVCMAIHCHKRPVGGKEILGRLVYGINSVADWLLRQFYMLGMEIYKALFIQKGIIIMALFIYVVFGLSFTVTIPVTDSTELATRQYTAELEGEITEDTLQRMEEIQAELDNVFVAYEEAKAQYESGEMEYPQYDVFIREADAAKIKSDGLAVVKNRVEELCTLSKEKGITPYLIEESLYKGTYGNEARSNQQNASVVAILAIVLLLAGSIAYETQSGMNDLLASTLRGRRMLFQRKVGMAVIFTTVVWAITYGLEFYIFLNICNTATFAASVQNLSMLETFPIYCSIGTFLFGLYMFRWFALFVCAMLTMLISAYMKRLETAYIVTTGVIVLPSVLYFYMGIEPLKYLSLALLIEVMPILINGDKGIVKIVCISLVYLISIRICAYFIKKRLKVTK